MFVIHENFQWIRLFEMLKTKWYFNYLPGSRFQINRITLLVTIFIVSREPDITRELPEPEATSVRCHKRKYLIWFRKCFLSFIIHGFTTQIIQCMSISQRYCNLMHAQNLKNYVVVSQLCFCFLISFCKFYLKTITHEITSLFERNICGTVKRFILSSKSRNIFTCQFR